MMKLALFLTAILTISTGAFAATDCPLKNLKKSQTLQADKTAFYPQHSTTRNSYSQNNSSRVSVGK